MKGSVTVFLALSLSLLTGFVLLLTEGVIKNVEKIRLEGVMDLGMNSVLGEFHMGLHERYGLLYIDLSYDAGNPSLQKLEDRLDFFVRQNTVTPKEVKVRQVASAAFADGNSMKFQAVCYMQDSNHSELSCGESWHEIKELGGCNAMAEWSELMNQISNMELPKIKNEAGEWVEIPLNNPADGVFGLTGHDMLYLAGVDGSGIGVGVIQAESYASRRVLQNIEYGEEKVADTELFIAYLLEKMGNYQNIRENSFLQYQLEYIAMGKYSDYENIQAMGDMLLQWCFTKNVNYAMGNNALWSEALKMAEGLKAVALKESFREPVAQSMIYALAYLESLAEIQCLFDGGNINITKSGFYTQWEQVYAADILQISSAVGGLKYEDFLIAAIMELPERSRNLRSMDIMEMDIRMISQNPEFAMDFCVERVEAEIIHKEYDLRRTYGYY